MSETKFYYYNIWIEDENGNRLNPMEDLSDEAFSQDLYEIAEKDDKEYACQFDMVRTNEHYGVLIRTKDDSGFVRLRDDGRIVPLGEVTEDDGGTGDIDYDYVDFAIRTQTSNIEVLVKVGFQTPGIGMISEYISQHVEYGEEYEVRHETRSELPPEEKLDRLLDSDLKKVDISFKKHPEPRDGGDVGETLESLTPDDYRLEFGVSLHKRKDPDKRRVEEYVGNITSMLPGGGDGSVKNSILQIDFPKLMHTFRVVGIDEDEQEVEENLADTVMKEKIDTSRYGIFDSDLGEELCENLRNVGE